MSKTWKGGRGGVGRNIPNLKMCQCEDITFGRKNVLRIPSNVAQNGSLDRASIMCNVCDDPRVKVSGFGSNFFSRPSSKEVKPP